MNPRVYAWLADLVMVAHACFVAFVVFGALLARRWRRLRPLHLAAALYAVAISAVGWVCPLTYLENGLRAMAGQPVDERSFLARLLEPLIYGYGDLPQGLILAGTILILAASLLVYYHPTDRPARLGRRAGR